MRFNPDLSVLIFNNNQVIGTPYQKHLGLSLDDKLNFGEHLRHIANKVNTGPSIHPLGYYVNLKNVYRDDH